MEFWQFCLVFGQLAIWIAYRDDKTVLIAGACVWVFIGVVFWAHEIVEIKKEVERIEQMNHKQPVASHQSLVTLGVNHHGNTW